MEDTIAILALLATPKIGRRTVRELLNLLVDLPADARGLYQQLVDAKSSGLSIALPSEDDLSQALRKAEKTLVKAKEAGIHVISPTNPTFPHRLRKIPDPPVILYAKGDLTCLTAEFLIAVVGTREPSPYGHQSATRFGSVFAEQELVVVSGLAVGCDTAAHRGCLKVGGQTIAVMAHGLDKVYPSSNHALAQEIVGSNGCLVSEYAPEVRAQRSYFVERDRLQSGLCNAVVVVETDVKGGTMHTARFCLEQGKSLACLVHPPDLRHHPKSKGNQLLLSEGKAKPLRTRNDVDLFLTEITGKRASVVRNSNTQRGAESSSDLKQLPLF